jgi:hypothetical protein
LYVINYTFVNDAGSGTFLFIGDKVGTPAVVQNNVFAGPGTVSTQAGAIQEDNQRSEKPGFMDRAGYTLKPVMNAQVKRAGPVADPWAAGAEARSGAAYRDHVRK